MKIIIILTILILLSGNKTMALSSAQKAALKARNTINGQLDERAYYYDKISAQQGGDIPLNNYENIEQPVKVLGASTGGNGYLKSSSSSYKGNDTKKLKKSISSQFDDIIGNYKSQINELPGQQQRLLSGVDEMANTQKATITSALDNILGKLQGQRGEIQTQQKQTLQDLSDNTRNLFQAGNVYLGARGAGNSSATGMYSAALTQNANKERAGVQRDVNSMYNDVATKEADVQTDFQAQLNEVDSWKQTQTQNIVMQYTDLKRQLEQAKAQAKGMEKNALAKLEMDLYNNAQQQLMQIQSAASQAMQGLNQGVQSGSVLGQRGAQSIQRTGDYQVGQVYQPGEVDLSGLQDVGYGNEAMYDSMTGNFWRVNDDGSVEYLGNK